MSDMVTNISKDVLRIKNINDKLSSLVQESEKLIENSFDILELDKNRIPKIVSSEMKWRVMADFPCLRFGLQGYDYEDDQTLLNLTLTFPDWRTIDLIKDLPSYFVCAALCFVHWNEDMDLGSLSDRIPEMIPSSQVSAFLDHLANHQVMEEASVRVAEIVAEVKHELNKANPFHPFCRASISLSISPGKINEKPFVFITEIKSEGRIVLTDLDGEQNGILFRLGEAHDVIYERLQKVSAALSLSPSPTSVANSERHLFGIDTEDTKDGIRKRI